MNKKELIDIVKKARRVLDMVVLYKKTLKIYLFIDTPLSLGNVEKLLARIDKALDKLNKKKGKL